MRRTVTLRSAALLLLAAGLGAGCHRSRREVVEQTRSISGTPFTIRVYAEPSDRLWSAISEAFDRVSEIVRLLNEYSPGSDVAKLNAEAGGEPVPVSPEALFVLQQAREVSEKSAGAFDVTWAVLRDPWGTFERLDRDPHAKPFQEKVERLRQKIGWERLELNPEAGTARLAERGMQIGLGAIAKGFAIDEAAKVLVRMGFRDFVIDGGGDLMVQGRRNSRDWSVGLRHPRGGPGDAFAVLPIRDRAVATTGDYERFVEFEGQRYSHILDPRTGYPAAVCLSATVIHSSAVLADALATAAFVLGPGPGLELIRRFPGAEAVIVDPNLGVHVTPGLQTAVSVRWLKPIDPTP